MDNEFWIGGMAAAALAGMGGTYFVVSRLNRKASHPAPPAPSEARPDDGRRDDLLEQSRVSAEQIVRDAEFKARDEAISRREELTRELENARAELREQERRAEKKEGAAEQKLKELTRKEKHLEALKEKIADRKETLEKKNKHLDALIEAENKRLFEITGLSPEAAQKLLLERLERELSAEFATKIRQHEERLKQHGEAKAREILTTTIQRWAAEHTATATVSTVDIPSDDMKGRIIGREGRNIRTFEKCTGVDVIVDDTPGVVIVFGLRQRPARNGAPRTHQADPGRAHPPQSHRGSGGGDAGRDGEAHYRTGPPGRR